MKNVCRIGLLAFVGTLVAAFAVGAGEQKSTSLEKRLLGAWSLASNVLVDQDGKKSEPYGADAKGTVIFSGKRVALMITRAELPKFASNNRTTGTAEENKAAVAGTIAYFGSYEVNEAEKVLTMHLEGCTFPNWAGTDQKRNIELTGDELKFINKSPSMGQGLITVTWKRIKEPQKTASAK
ncbi:MAG TPA: lipocalin-like domain-containing protein [Myxococcales bacterium]|nr:lipocalin-like domain-containing protein [Myxococcales bacterium]